MIMTIFKYLWMLILIGVYLYGWWSLFFCKNYKGKPIDEEFRRDVRIIWLLFNLFLMFLASIVCMAKF
jgi:hypothetical protein